MCIALGPAAVYMLVLGALNRSRRPLVVAGVRDMAALGLAISGMILVGPLELFVPDAAVMRYGWFVWPLLIAFYAMCVVMVLLLMRPRLIVYNVSADELRPILADLAAQIDGGARWAGDSLDLPSLGVQLHFETSVWMRNVSLVSSGGRQNYLGWRRLERELSAALVPIELRSNPRGYSLLSAGTLILLFLIINIARDPEAVGQALIDLLRL
ncbi:MAG: hypothetical protein RBS80_24135 [Thermoguttaceae bacterium]|jgi:uncharacterized SAM-binding protein YcdF (DUF218 family)|nr:hypothetical protein [Thermoguttaceae bacterium]